MFCITQNLIKKYLFLCYSVNHQKSSLTGDLIPYSEDQLLGCSDWCDTRKKNLIMVLSFAVLIGLVFFFHFLGDIIQIHISQLYQYSFYFHYMYFFIYACSYTHAMQWWWMAEDNQKESVFFFHYVCLSDQIPDIRMGGKKVHLLSHVSGLAFGTWTNFYFSFMVIIKIKCYKFYLELKM